MVLYATFGSIYYASVQFSLAEHINLSFSSARMMVPVVYTDSIQCQNCTAQCVTLHNIWAIFRLQ